MEERAGEAKGANPGPGISNLLLLIDRPDPTQPLWWLRPDLLMQLPQRPVDQHGGPPTMRHSIAMGIALPPGLHSMRQPLEVVLNGADDPGPFPSSRCMRDRHNIPTQAENAAGSALT